MNENGETLFSVEMTINSSDIMNVFKSYTRVTHTKKLLFIFIIMYNDMNEANINVI